MESIFEQMKTILAMDWNIEGENKKVWEWIRDKKLTSAPAFKGNLYDTASVKIMFVGHAVNGWEFETDNCINLEKTVETILKQNNGLATLVKKEGFLYKKKNGTEGYYKHINSRFWRLIKKVLEQLEESDESNSIKDEKSWYEDAKSWNEKIVWTNLYNVAPRDGGNPEDKMIKPCMEQYVEMLRLQLEQYKPDVVIICPLKGYFIPWKRQKSFDEIFVKNNDLESRTSDTIIWSGKLGSTEAIVCKRPDKPGMSYEDVDNMSKEIVEYINLKKKPKLLC